MSLLTNEVFLSFVIGAFGAGIRLALQRYRDKTWADVGAAASLLFLGAAGGWIAFLIEGYTPLAMVGLGFMAPDVIENLMAANSPQ